MCVRRAQIDEHCCVINLQRAAVEVDTKVTEGHLIDSLSSALDQKVSLTVTESPGNSSKRSDKPKSLKLRTSEANRETVLQFAASLHGLIFITSGRF